MEGSVSRSAEQPPGAAESTDRGLGVNTNGRPLFLTARQVANMLQVDERTVLRWAQHDASMPATRLGRVVRFEREPLLRWLARKHPRSARSFVSEQDAPSAA